MSSLRSLFRRRRKPEYHPDVPPPGSPPSDDDYLRGYNTQHPYAIYYPNEYLASCYPPGHPKRNPPPPPPLPTRQFQPPPGPPPQQIQEPHPFVTYYPPPPGPPPGQTPTANSTYDAPPSDPSNSSSAAGGGDVPPPAFNEGNQYFYDSPASNASEKDADAAAAFCDRNPLFAPTLTPPQTSGFRLSLYRPSLFKGTIEPFRISSTLSCDDSCILSAAPIYAANFPVAVSAFNLTIRRLGLGRGKQRAVVALGAVSPPYPDWRLPGWQRHSFGVHSDDGHRYFADAFGGMRFTDPFKEGETMGFVVRWGGRAGDGEKIPTVIEFWRNRRLVKSWREDEEWDGTVERGDLGMDGSRDVFAAVGIWGEAEVEVNGDMPNGQ